MSSQIISQFQSFIHQHYSGVLSISPVDSTTPFEIENTLTGEKEFLFISKLSPFMYAPVKGRPLTEPTDVTFTLYNEGKDLIVRFELLDMILESAIHESKAKEFLTVLLHQEKITLAIVDADTYNLIWLTNTIPFQTIRFHYKEIFEMYGVL